MAEKYKYYHYNPSKAAAVIFTVLFLLTSLFHLVQTIRQRTWYFLAIVVGGFMEAVGYAARIKSSLETPNWKLGPYIMQALLILVAPALVAATIYMILGRIILVSGGEQYSLIKKKWLTKIFVAGDVLSFLVLAGGSSLLTSKDPTKIKNGERIILIGLFIQIVFFGLFALVALIWHKRMRSNSANLPLPAHLPWPKHMYVLYLTIVLIMVRSIIRVIEYIQGSDGYILTHEVFLYIFDGALMFLAVAIFNVIHPRALIEAGKGTPISSSVEMGLR
ncbi:putative RTA1 domain protein [Bisporella sp. PMI_857]|nr:putative RTA1 domain protein [Bisporella sp. PMI_857]